LAGFSGVTGVTGVADVVVLNGRAKRDFTIASQKNLSAMLKGFLLIFQD